MKKNITRTLIIYRGYQNFSNKIYSQNFRTLTKKELTNKNKSESLSILIKYINSYIINILYENIK